MPILDDLSKGIKKGLQEAEKGLKQVGDKASDTVKTMEIKQEISKLESEITDLKLAIGEKAVELIGEGASLNPELDELVSKIAGIQTKIEGKKARIEEIQND